MTDYYRPERFMCWDCGHDTRLMHEQFMVWDEMWADIARGVYGHLCIGCFEIRLGRTLCHLDFTDAPLNRRQVAGRLPSLRMRHRMRQSTVKAIDRISIN